MFRTKPTISKITFNGDSTKRSTSDGILNTDMFDKVLQLSSVFRFYTNAKL